MIVPDTEEDEATEVPMLHLASFALHKLFTEWQADGFEIPDFKNMQPPGQPGQIEAPGEKIPQQPLQLGRTEVPEKANTMHPTTLLCMVNSIYNKIIKMKFLIINWLVNICLL